MDEDNHFTANPDGGMSVGSTAEEPKLADQGETPTETATESTTEAAGNEGNTPENEATGEPEGSEAAEGTSGEEVAA